MAAAQIREVSDWWKQNRPAAPDLLRSELNRAFDLITRFPGAGAVTPTAEVEGVRRVLMLRTRYHVYYTFSESVVTVLAVWHARRGSSPSF